MQNETLKDFFRHKKVESEGQHIDWESKKQICLNSLEKLYNDINHWLTHSIEEEIIQIRYEKTMLSEDYIDSYSVSNMILSVGFERVFFKPKGMIIMGSAGQVDMIGENGTVWLLLVENPKESEFTWHIVIRTVRKKYWPLTDEYFADALKWVMQK